MLGQPEGTVKESNPIRIETAEGIGNGPAIIPFHIDPDGLQVLVITQEVEGGVPQSEGSAVVSWFDA